MKGYDTVDYARSRLVETIIRLDDKPIMVHDCGTKQGKITVIYTDIVEDDGDSKSVYLDKCNLDPVPLGYVNHSGNSTYLTRMPMRKDWRQGARMLNLVDPTGYNPNKISYRNIGQTIMGKFPSLTSALEALNKVSPISSKPLQSLAFSREFAIRREGQLVYKGLFDVGHVDMNNGSTLVDDKFNWVREALEEALEQAA